MYKIIDDSTVLRVADWASIPKNLGNADYVAYLDWLRAGNVPGHVSDDATEGELPAG